MEKSLFFLKQSLVLVRKTLIQSGSIVMFAPNGYYFKNTNSKNFLLRKSSILEIKKGIFSNHIYAKYKTVLPNIAVIFNINKHYSFIKELKALGVPIIGILEKSDIFLFIEYPIFLNSFSYFLNYYILALYSQICLISKN
jgi:hypothetical protein